MTFPASPYAAQALRKQFGAVLIATSSSLALAQNPAPESEEVMTLPPVVVSAAGYEQLVVDAPASVSVITREDIETQSYRDVTDALQDIPGVTIEGGPGRKATTAEVSIRGMDSKYTLLLVDGRSQGSGQAYYNGEGGGVEFGWLPPLSAIERIEVVRGPMSSLYGSDALGGVINIITRQVTEKWSGSLTLDTVLQHNKDSGTRREARYYLTGPLIKDTLGITIFGSQFKRQEDEIASGYREREKRDTTAKLSWTPNAQHTVRLEAGIADQESTGTPGGIGSDTFKEMTRYQQAVSHDMKWGEDRTTSSYVQREKLDNITQDALYERVTANTHTTIPLDRHMLSVGAQYRTQKTENPARAKNLANLERWDAALFAEDEWFLNDALSFTGGGRWVKDENYGSEVTPRLYTIYRSSPALTFKGGISAGYRTPDLKQGDSLWVEGGGGRNTDGADIGNSDLEPEKSLNYEAAMLWNAKNGFSGSFTVYLTEFENKIEKPVICQESAPLAYDCSYLGVSYQRVYQYQNVDEAELRGFEATVDYIKGRLKLAANYTYADSEQKTGDSKGEPLNNQPKSRANINLDWRASNSVNLWTKVRYKSKTLEGSDSQIPSYTFVDAGLSYAHSKNLRLYTGIYNLGDKQITYEKHGKVLDGRRLNMGVILEF